MNSVYGLMKRLTLCAGLVWLAALAALAQTQSDTQAAYLRLPREEKIRRALLAAPEHLRKDAAVLVLEKDGYVKAKEGTNGFTCIETGSFDHPAPECFDAESAATILKRPLRIQELLAAGKSQEEVRAILAEELRTGKLPKPQRVGVVYMYAPENFSFKYPAHAMFYAPNEPATNASIGATDKTSSGMSLPWILPGENYIIALNLAAGEKYEAPPTPASISNPAPSQDGLPILLPRAQEIEMALSAGPEAIRQNATVYVLERGKGFVKARAGTNGFSCLVLREGHHGTSPNCFDAEGSATTLLARLRTAQLQESGKSEAEVNQLIASEYKSGKLLAPRRNGLVYMLSQHNYVKSQSGKLVWYPPHYMVYAPYLKNADIGAQPAHLGSPHHPWVLNEGQPDAYIIIVPPKGKGGHQHATN